ncbi:hypothetical protein B7486_46875 [cyanobacterium TDX16]|nr:hypothetical protein B7486_46875 [cyanobacterium TDX16]
MLARLPEQMFSSDTAMFSSPVRNPFPIDLYDIWHAVGFTSQERARRHIIDTFRPSIDYISFWHDISVQTQGTRKRMRVYKLSLDCVKTLALQSNTVQAQRLYEGIAEITRHVIAVNTDLAINEVTRCSDVVSKILVNFSSPLTKIAMALRLLNDYRHAIDEKRARAYSSILEDEARKLLGLFDELGRLHETITDDRLALLESYQLLRTL